MERVGKILWYKFNRHLVPTINEEPLGLKCIAIERPPLIIIIIIITAVDGSIWKLG